MVLQNYSWPDFLLAALLLSLLWYLVVWLVYFRRRPGARASGPLPHSWQKGLDVLEEGDPGSTGAEGESLLGASVGDQGISVVSAEEVGFGESLKAAQLGVLPDVQQEIGKLCLELESTLGTKEDFLQGFARIRAAYEIPEGAQGALNGFIREHVPFYLSSPELEGLWV